MKAAFDEISQHKLDGTQTVYFEVSPIQWGLWTAGKNTFMNEIAEMMGLRYGAVKLRHQNALVLLREALEG